MREQKFVASYEDAAKTERRAKAAGWNEADGGYLDLVDPVHSQREFASKVEAEAWLMAEINAYKTCFGCGDIDVLEKVERRCRYCICNGWREIQSFIVDDTGICEDRGASDDLCCDD